jgi:hypothetical protein
MVLKAPTKYVTTLRSRCSMLQLEDGVSKGDCLREALTMPSWSSLRIAREGFDFSCHVRECSGSRICSAIRGLLFDLPKRFSS